MHKLFFFFLVSAFSLILTGCAQDELKSTVSFDEFQEKGTQASSSKQEDVKHTASKAEEIPAEYVKPAAVKTGEVSEEDVKSAVIEAQKADGVELHSESKDWVQRHVAALPNYTDIIDSDVPKDYTLGPGDLVEITVFETEDLNTQARVSSRGFVSLPLLNQVDVQGLTAGEAEEKIEKLLRENYLHDPHVTLFIREMISQQITMVGALERPGKYDFMNSKTIMDMIALAGGLIPEAGDIAYVSRKVADSKNNEKQIYMVNLYQLITKGNIEMNMPMRGGDVIFVPVAGMVHVDGAVNEPGAFRLEPEMTIDKAIAAAGGLESYADTDDIKLIRHNDQGKRDIIQLSMQDIRSASIKDLLLKSDDVVFVEVSGTKTFLQSWGFSFGFLGTGFSYESPNQN